ncbi:MAG TPA: flagellin, partial [Candidatus Limnocylindrales bacterium]
QSSTAWRPTSASTRINTNIEALNAERNLTATAAKYASSVEKLSSGLRINRAADDAAGLAISERLQAQVTGLNQAQRNAQDGVSMVQTAEGALNEVHSMLQRIRELAVEAGNSTLGQSDAQSVNAEVTALQAEITRIASTTTFNGQNLLTNALTVSQTGGTVNNGFVVASGTNTAVTNVSVQGAKASTTYTMTSAAGAGTVTLSAGGNSQTLTLQAILANGSQTLNFGNMGVSVTVASVTGDSAANVSAGLVGSGTGNTIITGAGSGATFQIGANQNDTLGVTFADARTAAYAGFDTAITNFTTAANSGSGITAAAGALITATDTAISGVSTIRANFGAVENRLQHTVASLSVASENLNASESRIKDLDVAAEMVNFTKNSILQQAGTSILAQANQAPQSILTLLR